MRKVSFASLAYENKKKKTRREKFLEEQDGVIPWDELLQIIKQYYPRAGDARRPMPLDGITDILYAAMV